MEMKGMQKAVSCSLCFEVFQAGVRDPLVLPCGHTFCRSCLNSIKQAGNFSCPNCRQSHNNILLERLSVNYSILSLLSACPDFEFEDCTEHGDNLRYWCCKCELPLCSLCLYSGHPQGHNVKLIKAYVEERKVALEAQIKLHEVKIDDQRGEVKRSFVKMVEGVHKLCETSSTLHNTQLEKDRLLLSVRKANSIETIKQAEKRVKEYIILVKDRYSKAKNTSAIEYSANESIKTDDADKKTQKAKNTTGASKPIHLSLNWMQNKPDFLRAALNCQDGRLLLNCVAAPTDSRISLQLPSEVFLELSVGDRCLGQVYIRLWCHMRRAHQFMALCLGTLGPSYKGTTASKVISTNVNGKFIIFENVLDKKSPSIRPVFVDLEWAGNYSMVANSGHIVAFESGSQNGNNPSFGICTQKSCTYTSVTPSGKVIPNPKAMGTTFGDVISGLNVVNAAITHHTVTQVTISQCGLVLPDFKL